MQYSRILYLAWTKQFIDQCTEKVLSEKNKVQGETCDDAQTHTASAKTLTSSAYSKHTGPKADQQVPKKKKKGSTSEQMAGNK